MDLPFFYRSQISLLRRIFKSFSRKTWNIIDVYRHEILNRYARDSYIDGQAKSTELAYIHQLF